ncbi:MAG: hypothetical protein ACK6BG_10120 [Cyanobacteriota bacterium]
MADSLDELMKNYNSMVQQWLTLSQPLFASVCPGLGAPEGEGMADASALSRAMLQALGAASTSSLSYGCSIQSIISKYQASLLALNLSHEDSQLKRAKLIDDVRGFLREVGESASREGRHFQHQLAMITEQLAQAEANTKSQPHQSETTPRERLLNFYDTFFCSKPRLSV